MQGPSAYGIIAAAQVIIGPAGGWFIYNGDPGPGNPPIAYSVPASVIKDPFGNSLPLSGGVVSLLSASEWCALSQGAIFFFNSPDEAQIALTSGGILEVQGVSSPVPANMLKVVSSDGNTYSTQYLDVILPSNFTIGSSSAPIFPSVQVSIGTYTIEVWLVQQNTVAADAAQYQFQGPAAATTPQLVEFESKTQAGPTTIGYGASATYTTQFSSQQVAGNQGIYVRATVAFTTAGTLTFNGQELVAGNTVTVSAGSRFRLTPV